MNISFELFFVARVNEDNFVKDSLIAGEIFMA